MTQLPNHHDTTTEPDDTTETIILDTTDFSIIAAEKGTFNALFFNVSLTFNHRIQIRLKRDLGELTINPDDTRGYKFTMVKNYSGTFKNKSSYYAYPALFNNAGLNPITSIPDDMITITNIKTFFPQNLLMPQNYAVSKEITFEE